MIRVKLHFITNVLRLQEMYPLPSDYLGSAVQYEQV